MLRLRRPHMHPYRHYFLVTEILTAYCQFRPLFVQQGLKCQNRPHQTRHWPRLRVRLRCKNLRHHHRQQK